MIDHRRTFGRQQFSSWNFVPVFLLHAIECADSSPRIFYLQHLRIVLSWPDFNIVIKDRFGLIAYLYHLESRTAAILCTYISLDEIIIISTQQCVSEWVLDFWEIPDFVWCRYFQIPFQCQLAEKQNYSTLDKNWKLISHFLMWW